MRLAMNKRVWILGAGFSQPLGGPLLKDLFRLEPRQSCEATFPTVDYPNLAEHLLALQTGFYWGREKAGYWDDAEQFLAFIDDAYSGPDAIKRDKLNALIGSARRPHWTNEHQLKIADLVPDTHPLLNDLDRIARRALAAQCECFLFNRDPQQEEAWTPFLRWAKSLSPTTDALVTFNYDRVLEKLDSNETTFQVVMPGQARDEERVPVYKLHGSVDWLLQDGQLRRGNAVESLRSRDAQIAIAAPGLGKTHLVAERFSDLWLRADEAISHADVVLIVGYSFPKSDSMALHRILDALKVTAGVPPLRDVHLVLGAETTAATRRVAALLQACTAGRCLEVVPPEAPFDSHHNTIGRPARILAIKQHPLWTQDFLGDWQDRAKRIPLA
jgi:hypothetical protein